MRESIANLMAFVELGSRDDVLAVFEHAGAFDWIAVDCDQGFHQGDQKPPIDGAKPHLDQVEGWKTLESLKRLQRQIRRL